MQTLIFNGNFIGFSQTFNLANHLWLKHSQNYIIALLSDSTVGKSFYTSGQLIQPAPPVPMYGQPTSLGQPVQQYMQSSEPQIIGMLSLRLCFLFSEMFDYIVTN